MNKMNQAWMLQRNNIIRGIGVLMLVTCTGLSFADGRELSDDELDEVVAGTVDESLQEELLRFSYVGPAGPRHEAEIDGTLSVSGGPLPGVPTGLLMIDNGAQTDLSALVNLNAVNSQVNILLNLNISINSVVGEIHQINIKSR
jgi:hypothetical protein